MEGKYLPLAEPAVGSLQAPHTVAPRVITVDKSAAYPKAFNQLQEEGILPKSCALQQSKYLNNLVE
jgi:transposase-like protein